MKKQTYTVTHQDTADLKGLKKKTGINKSEYVRRALDDFFRKLGIRR